MSVHKKYGFRIRTRQGLLVEHLSLYARDELDAEKKLRQMYRQCEILDCRVLGGAPILLQLASKG